MAEILGREVEIWPAVVGGSLVLALGLRACGATDAPSTNELEDNIVVINPNISNGAPILNHKGDPLECIVFKSERYGTSWLAMDCDNVGDENAG